MKEVIDVFTSAFLIIVWFFAALGLGYVAYYSLRIYKYFARRRQEKSLNVIVIPDGNEETEVLGEQYRMATLREIYSRVKTEKIVLSITSMSQYQHDKGWPKPVFVNVNLHGARHTTKENWLGYIPERFWDCDFNSLLEQYDRVDVYGHIAKTADGFSLLVTIDKEFIDKSLT